MDGQQVSRAGWKADASGYGWTYYDGEGKATGWLVGLYRINGTPTYMLWHGNETQGKFDTLELAQGKHAELTGLDRGKGGTYA